jgi:hypothetical protein
MQKFGVGQPRASSSLSASSKPPFQEPTSSWACDAGEHLEAEEAREACDLDHVRLSADHATPQNLRLDRFQIALVEVSGSLANVAALPEAAREGLVVLVFRLGRPIALKRWLLSDEQIKVTEAVFTFVAIDSGSRPRPLPLGQRRKRTDWSRSSRASLTRSGMLSISAFFGFQPAKERWRYHDQEDRPEDVAAHDKGDFDANGEGDNGHLGDAAGCEG